MIKNKLFTIITIASLRAFTCYGMDIEDNYGITYNTSNGYLVNYDKATKTTTYYDYETGKETILPPINLLNETELPHIDEQQTTPDHKKLPIVKLSQPKSMNIINGLEFVPHRSPLRSFYKHPQYKKDLETIANGLSASNRLSNLQRELDLLAKPQRHHELFNTLQRKIIQTNYNTIDLSFKRDEFNAAANRIIESFSPRYKDHATEEILVAMKNAQNNRPQGRLS